MKLDIVAGSGNDEFYTPEYAIVPLVKHLRFRGLNKIWCPFDTRESNFVKVLTLAGFTVVASHISEGMDFFTCSIPECDAIVSNPPYSKKAEVFDRLFTIGKPFAMLVGVVGLFESDRRFSLFERNPFEIMYFNKRISYFKSYNEQKPSLNPPFSSVYITYGILRKQICFERIDK
jgi:hypothetical protein